MLLWSRILLRDLFFNIKVLICNAPMIYSFGMKICNKCHESKPLESFYKEKDTKDGYRCACKKCRDNARERHRDANRAKYNTWHVQYMKEHPLSKIQKDQQTSRVMKCRYGITLDEYNSLLEKQGGHCALCKKRKNNKSGRRLAIDHCHKSGRIRGILCDGCNVSIHILENPELYEKAIAYLTQ